MFPASNWITGLEIPIPMLGKLEIGDVFHTWRTATVLLVRCLLLLEHFIRPENLRDGCVCLEVSGSYKERLYISRMGVVDC